MKNVQIPYELFLDLVMYHLRGEDDYDEDIRQGLEEKLDAILSRMIYSEYSVKKHGRNTLTAGAYRKVTAGLFRLGNCDRSVPRSCSRYARQMIRMTC